MAAPPGLSTGVSTGVQKHWPGHSSRPRSFGPTGGEVPSPDLPGTGVADHISAVDNATNGHARGPPAGSVRSAGACTRIVDAALGAVHFAAVRAPYLHPSRQYVVVALLISGWRWRAAPREPHLFAARAFEEAMREEDLSTQQPQAKQEARLSPADADESRTRGSAQSPGQGPLAPVGLIWPVRERSTFRALAQSRRRRRGAVMVSSAIVGPSTEPPACRLCGRARRRRCRRAQSGAPEAAGRDPLPRRRARGRPRVPRRGDVCRGRHARTPDLSTALHDALSALREDAR